VRPQQCDQTTEILSMRSDQWDNSSEIRPLRSDQWNHNVLRPLRSDQWDQTNQTSAEWLDHWDPIRPMNLISPFM